MKYITGLLLTIGAAITLFFGGMAKGAGKVREKGLKAALKNSQTAKRIDDAIDKASDDELDDTLSPFMLDDDEK